MSFLDVVTFVTVSRSISILIDLQLILNVDCYIAVCSVDPLGNSGAFTSDEADEYIKVGVPELLA